MVINPKLHFLMNKHFQLKHNYDEMERGKDYV